MSSNHLVFCHPLLLLPLIIPSIRVFSSESALPICGRSICASASPSVLLINIQDWFPLGLTGLNSLQSKGLSKVFSNIIVQKHQFFGAQLSLWSNFHIYTWPLYVCIKPYIQKTIALTIQTCVGKVMSLLFNMLSRLVIAFLSRSTRLLISWLQSPPAMILDPKKRKSVNVSIVSPSICHEVMGPDAMIFMIWMLGFKPAFSLSSFTYIKRLFSSSLLSAIRVVSSACLRWLVFLPAILIPACAHPVQHLAWGTLHIS